MNQLRPHPDDGWNKDPVLLREIQRRWVPRDLNREDEDLRLLQQFVPLTPNDRSVYRESSRPAGQRQGQGEADPRSTPVPPPGHGRIHLAL